MLNGMDSVMAVLHSTHFFMMGAQFSQATMWLHGLKSTLAGASEQTRQSSIWKILRL